MSTDKSSQPIDPLEILTRFNWAESDDLEFKSPRSGLPGSLRETYTAIANSQDDVILLGVGDDGKSGLAQEGVGRWTRYRLPEMRNSPHTDSDSPHKGRHSVDSEASDTDGWNERSRFPDKPNRVEQAYTAAEEQEETDA